MNTARCWTATASGTRRSSSPSGTTGSPSRRRPCRAPPSRATYCRNDADNGTGFALAGNDGTLTKAGNAFKAVGSLRRTPLRVAATGGDDQGFSVLAGRSWRRVRVLISNYEIPAADQGPLPFPDNLFAIPGIATFTILDRRPVTYTDNGGYDLTVRGLR